MDQQASGGEDPNKPTKKKSHEDESKNKKLVRKKVSRHFEWWYHNRYLHVFVN